MSQGQLLRLADVAEMDVDASMPKPGSVLSMGYLNKLAVDIDKADITSIACTLHEFKQSEHLQLLCSQL